MYFYELFSHSDRFAYRTHLISNATFVLIICTALTLLPPFLLTYYTGDFWTTEAIYSEQPRFDNTTKYILIAENNNADDNEFFLSSYSALNINFQNSLISGTTAVSSFDIDGDGLIDQFRVSFDLEFASTTTVIRNINIWLILNYALNGKQSINAETMALISFVPPSQLTPGDNQNLTIYGQLIFEQRQPIESSGSDSTYDTSIIDIDSSSSSPPDLDSILSNYYTRNYYTSYQTQYTWMVPRTTIDTNTLTVNVVVNVGRQSIRYVPGFWQAFKWGWIQYISVLLPFMFVFNRVKLFVFSNHIVQTSVPLSKHRHQA
jgi:transmembrane protein 231